MTKRVTIEATTMDVHQGPAATEHPRERLVGLVSAGGGAIFL
jgi:hypothetical protein